MDSLFGIFNVNKPKGITSHDVVSKLRKILNMKQIGHTGTLDPMATGVLPICVGKATKIIQYLEGSKAYEASIKLGIETDSYDMEGEILHTKKVHLDIDELKLALTKFQGDIKQKPPIYSAVHYNGKRLYEYARANTEVVDIPEREVRINSIELLDVDETEQDNPVIKISVDCSSGTYIRSIAHDLGQILDCGATLSGLIRTRAGKFNIETSHTIESIQEFKNAEKIDEILINPVCVLELKYSKISENQLNKVKQGQYLMDINIDADEGEIIQLIYDDSLVAIAKFNNNAIKPLKVFA